MSDHLAGIDWAVIAVYFAIVFAVAAWARFGGRHERDTEDYFLAGRNAGWLVIGASLFASNIGSEHLVGLAGSGAASGVPVAQFEIIAGLVLLLLGWLFVPFYLRSGVFTMPEFLERRYSAGPRTYLAVISIVGYVLTKIAVTIAAGGIIFESLMGIDFWTGAIVVVAATGLYTLAGGLKAVLYTDLVQTVILLAGAALVTWLGLDAAGGWDGVRASAGAAHFDLWRTFSDPEFPWTGILFGAPILGVWYWCTDQFIVQRVLSARSETDARRGTIFAGFLKQLPLFLFVLPGIVAFALAQQGVIAFTRADAALPALIGHVLPAGLKGVVVAGFLAALMSSLSSVFNSCATVFTIDIYKRLHPRAGERHLVVVGQLAVLVLIALGIAWIPFMGAISGRLFTYLQSVQAYISPPIAAVFLVGVLWPRANAKGAAAALAVGFVGGLARLVAELNAQHLSGWWLAFAQVNFLHVAIGLFALSVGVLVVVSLMSAPPPAHVRALTFAGGVRPAGSTAARRADIALSALLVALIGIVWWTFRG